jgi:hypothetical protein
LRGWVRIAARRLFRRRCSRRFGTTTTCALRYMADLSHGDIAEALGTTAHAARRNVFEGLTRLRRDLADDPHNL